MQINKVRKEKGKSQLTLQKYKRLEDTNTNNNMPKKMNNHEEMDKFLERYNFPTVNQEETENINRPITSMEIETIIKILPTNKSLAPDGFTGKFYQTIRD